MDASPAVDTSTIEIGHLRHEPGTVHVAIDGATVTWAVRGAEPWPSFDGAFALALMPAMRDGRPIRVDGAVSARSIEGSHTIQQLLHRWDTTMQPVEVHSAGTALPPPPSTGTGLYFSGGVDSFFSLLRHRHELTHLIIIRGFDITESEVWEDVRIMASSVAHAEGLGLIEVDTNARDVVRRLGWFSHGHGAVLASVGLHLQGTLARIIIGSSRDAQTLIPSGTHPELDPLWSTDALTFEHDELVSRTDKVASIADYPLALRWLRVCWRRPDLYNCGRCEKCVRTQIALRLSGALERCDTLPHEIDLRAVRRLRHHERSAGRVLASAEQADGLGDASLAAALRAGVRRSAIRRRARAGLKGVIRRG